MPIESGVDVVTAITHHVRVRVEPRLYKASIAWRDRYPTAGAALRIWSNSLKSHRASFGVSHDLRHRLLTNLLGEDCLRITRRT